MCVSTELKEYNVKGTDIPNLVSQGNLNYWQLSKIDISLETFVLKEFKKLISKYPANHCGLCFCVFLVLLQLFVWICCANLCLKSNEI